MTARVEIQDGMKVKALGSFAKGLRDGVTYTLQKAAPFHGVDTFNFVARGRVVARFDESQIQRYLRSGEGGDLNGLHRVASDAKGGSTALTALERMAKFPEGESVDVPAYLKEHDNPEAAKAWEKMNEEYGDKLKTASADSPLHAALLKQWGQGHKDASEFLVGATSGAVAMRIEYAMREMRTDTSETFADSRVLEQYGNQNDVSKILRLSRHLAARLNGALYWTGFVAGMAGDPATAKEWGIKIASGLQKQVADWMWVISKDSAGGYIITLGDPHKSGSKVKFRASGESYKDELKDWVRDNVGKKVSPNHIMDTTTLRLVSDTWTQEFVDSLTEKQRKGLKLSFTDPKIEILTIMGVLLAALERHSGKTKIEEAFAGAPGKKLPLLKEIQNTLVFATGDLAADTRMQDKFGKPGTQFHRGPGGQLAPNPPVMTVETANWWWGQNDAVQYTLSRRALDTKAKQLGVALDRALTIKANAVRPLWQVAEDIRKDWRPVNYAAKPYLDAMSELDSIHDSYGADSAVGVVAYFLTNASSWRGPVAAAIKAELKGMAKGSRRAALEDLERLADWEGEGHSKDKEDWETGKTILVNPQDRPSEGSLIPGLEDRKASAGDEKEGKFEEGKPADPKENMSEKDKKKWDKYHGKVEELKTAGDEWVAWA